MQNSVVEISIGLGIVWEFRKSIFELSGPEVYTSIWVTLPSLWRPQRQHSALVSHRTNVSGIFG